MTLAYRYGKKHIDEDTLGTIKVAVRRMIVQAGDEGIKAPSLCHGVLTIYGDLIDGPDLTMILCDLALRGQIGYLPTEDGFETDILVPLETS